MSDISSQALLELCKCQIRSRNQLQKQHELDLAL